MPGTLKLLDPVSISAETVILIYAPIRPKAPTVMYYLPGVLHFNWIQDYFFSSFRHHFLDLVIQFFQLSGFNEHVTQYLGDGERYGFSHLICLAIAHDFKIKKLYITFLSHC